jgi:3,5-epimerase/4-reductase
MKWLLYGQKGWIGGQLSELLQQQGEEVVAASARADDTEAVRKELAELKPDRVVCLVGRTHGPGFSTIDYLEQKGKVTENVRDNLFAPVSLALVCQEVGIHYTYLGTGCCFHYDEQHPVGGKGFAPGDKPNFVGSGYSAVKGFTDLLLRQVPALTCRIRMPLTGDRNPRNFITKITTYQKVVNIPNSMSVLHTLLPVMVDLARKQHVGIVNLVNPKPISHNEVLDLYKEIVDPTFMYSNFTVEEQEKILLAGRSNCYLDTSFIEEHYPEVPDIHEATRQCMLKMKAHDLTETAQ